MRDDFEGSVLEFNYFYSNTQEGNRDPFGEIDTRFIEFLKSKNKELHQEVQNIRIYNWQDLSPDYPSETIINLSIVLEEFLCITFPSILKGNPFPEEFYQKFNLMSEVKKRFIQKSVKHKYSNSPIPGSFQNEIEYTDEHQFCKEITALLHSQNALESDIEKYEKYAAWSLFHPDGARKHANTFLFKLPQKTGQDRLFHSSPEECISGSHQHKVQDTRENLKNQFSLTDSGNAGEYNFWHAGYCIHCHKREKDYCRTGLPNNPSIYPDHQDKTGCPLRQKISESQLVKLHGFTIAPLAIIMIDNPLCLLTGYRVCNDCAKSCIYQKQEPVDIPSVETQILKDALSLNYGFEIYYLLTQWNPLKRQCHIRKPHSPNNRNIAVAGMGPAGIAAAYYMLYCGFNVLCLEALSVKEDKFSHWATSPVQDATRVLSQDLSSRDPTRFGGVMEYGITVRWNKNFLDLARTVLARNAGFQIAGNARLGSTISHKHLFKTLKIAHLFVAVGAGNPKLPEIEKLYTNLLTSSDFLMRLQSCGHFLRATKSNATQQGPQKPLLPQIPPDSTICIIGAGLTAIDTACEARAYYRMMHKVNIRTVILCRTSVKQSKAYRENRLELEKALEEGIELLQNTQVSNLASQDGKRISEVELSNGTKLNAGFVIIAIGVEPNLLPLTELKSQSSEALEFNQQISAIGDCNPLYSGSVVKAIANVKDIWRQVYRRVASAQLPREHCILNNPTIAKPIISKSNIHKDSFGRTISLHIKSKFYADALVVGQTVRLEPQGINTYIPLTVISISRDTIELSVRILGQKTQKLGQAAVNSEVGLVNSHSKEYATSIFNALDAIICDQDKMHIFGKVAQHYNTRIIPLATANQAMREIGASLQLGRRESSKIKEYREGSRGAILIVTSDTHELSQIKTKESQKVLVYLFTPMNCMLKGVCSRCINRKRDGSTFYACQDPIVPLSELDIMSMDNKNI